MKSLKWSPIQCERYPYKKGKFEQGDRHTFKEDNVNAQGEGWPSVCQKHWRLPEARREAWKRFSLTALRRNQPH